MSSGHEAGRQRGLEDGYAEREHVARFSRVVTGGPGNALALGRPGMAIEVRASPPHRTLTVREVLKSFQFSQGSEALQGVIFQYLRLLHPELRVTTGDVAALEAACLAPARAIYHDTRRHPVSADDPVKAVRSVVELAYEVFNTWPPPDHAAVVTSLADGILARDEHFLLEEVGRRYAAASPADDPPAHFSPYTDPWRSDLCYFGLLGRTTGHPDFDRLFAEVAVHWRDRARERDAAHERTLRALVAEYNAHHPPELRVSLPPLGGRRE